MKSAHKPMSRVSSAVDVSNAGGSQQVLVILKVEAPKSGIYFISLPAL